MAKVEAPQNLDCCWKTISLYMYLMNTIVTEHIELPWVTEHIEQDAAAGGVGGAVLRAGGGQGGDAAARTPHRGGQEEVRRSAGGGGGERVRWPAMCPSLLCLAEEKSGIYKQ